MTELEAVKKEFEKKANEIKEKCQSARTLLKEMGFIGTSSVSSKLFKEVFESRFSYFIHDIKLMNFAEIEEDEQLQFMVTFEDGETEFIYLGAK